ncbi:MAG: sensory box protein [Osedax symbiont Rs2]|nr:MAG: sensory box protein [Osedax symbiont Rs2]
MNNQKIKNIIESLSNIKSNEFFKKICIALGNAVNADYVFIATLDDRRTTATSLAATHKGLIIDGFSYALKNTPCSKVANESLCTHSENVQQLYPDDKLLVDMGVEGYVGVPLKTCEGRVDAILVALFDNTISHIDEVETLFLLFSGLIEKELHKVASSKKIEFYKYIVEKSHDAIIVCDQNQFVTYVNPSFTRITGYSQSDLQGKTPKILSSDKQSEAFYQTMWANINENGHWQGQIWNKRKNGSEYLEWLSITSIFDEHSELTNYIAFFSNITEHYEAKEKIKYQDSYDALTKTANKNKLFQFIEKSISENHSPHKITITAALLVIDLDLFQKINGLYGYVFGDKVLIHVANTLQSLIRNNDIVSRTSGDNFALFANNIKDRESIVLIIDKITNAFIQPILIDGITIKITLSIGIACYSENATDAHGLFEKAEQAMFFSKDNGRNSYEFYTQQLSDEAKKEEELKKALELAIENNEFSLVYQPIVSLKEKSVSKFEALVRWDNNGSCRSPAEFIPAAEKFGLIKAIGDFVLNQACKELKILKKKGFTDIVFNINRSIYEFPERAKENKWIDTIQEHGLNPRDICFELTESVLAPENDNYIALLNKLQLAGCTIALDDFGTGYSSLSYLRRFPINVLKIDRSFILDMTKEKNGEVLVSAIISMAKALQVNVVAEGVELKNEVDILTRLNCDFIQGYYFSKPLKPEFISQYLIDFKL